MSRKTLVAIEAVLDIAYHSSTNPVQRRAITRRQGIPRRYLEQVLQNLVRAGVLTGVRGPRGGYRLARERRRITLADIVQVINELESTTDPINEDNGSPLGNGVVRPLWRQFTNGCMAQLAQTNIQDLCNQAHDAGVESEDLINYDYTI